MMSETHVKGACQILQSVWAFVYDQPAIGFCLEDPYEAHKMSLAGEKGTEKEGKAGGFDNRLSDHPSPESGKPSTNGSATQRCLNFLGKGNGPSSSPADEKMPSSGTDRSKAVSNDDDPKCRAHESDDGDVEYSPQYKRARRQLWVWRIVSYILIAAVIGASFRTVQDALVAASSACYTRVENSVSLHSYKVTCYGYLAENLCVA